MICKNCKSVVSKVIVTDNPKDIAYMQGDWIVRDKKWTRIEQMLPSVLCGECEQDLTLEPPMDERTYNDEPEPMPSRSNWQDTNGFRAYLQNKTKRS